MIFDTKRYSKRLSSRGYFFEHSLKLHPIASHSFSSKSFRSHLSVLLSFALVFSELFSVFYLIGMNNADAAYTGKRLRTVEYTLGGSSDTTSRASGTVTYAGTSWNTSVGTAGARSVILSGSNIRVVHAHVDTIAQPTTATNVTAQLVALQVASSSNPRDLVRVGQISGTFWAQSGNAEYLHFLHNATALFSEQTDADWAAGVPVTGMFSVTGPATVLRTMKLVITYEYDHNPDPHTEVKTIRFPLTSTTTADMGTISSCASAATCTFVATTTMPDLLASSTANILDVYYDLSVQVDSATASTFSPKIRGGSAGPSFNWTDTIAGDTNIRAIFRPAIGGNDFLSNSTQYLDVTMGTVGGRLLSGELVVTYEADTSSTRQMETVSYYLNQYTSTLGTARSNFATATVTISNASRRAANVWYRVNETATSTSALTLYGRVGTSSQERSATYSHTATNARDGMTPMLIFDLSQDAGQIWNSTTTLAGGVQYSSSGPAPGIEAMITFEWDGTQGGTETKTVLFGAAVPSVITTASGWLNAPLSVVLPEKVIKTYRSAYLRTTVHHSQATSITAGNVLIGVNGTSSPYAITVAEAADTTSEAFAADYLVPVASSTFSNGDTITWTSRNLEINATLSVANTQAFNHVLSVTYDAGYAENDPSPELTRRLRTVEYTLGGSSDTTSRASGTVTYAGTSWNTSVGTAGARSVILSGSNIRVVHAHVDTIAQPTTATNVTAQLVALQVASSSNPRDLVRVGQISGTFWAQSGNAEYLHFLHNATALFSEQTDADWAAGVPVTGMFSVTGPATVLRTMKLVITYEYDHNPDPHTEVKTIRFPLTSTTTADMGTISSCASAATCTFVATTTMPDLLASSTANILDVYYDLSVQVDSATASTFSPKIRGGSAGPSFNWTDTIAGDTNIRAIFRPAIGGNDFLSNSTQYLDVTMGTVGGRLLSGELVVTYEADTSSTRQMETVSYYLNQYTSTLGTARSNFATATVTISNASRRAANVWYRVNETATSTSALTLYGRVGTSSQERSATYSHTATNARDGMTPMLIFDLSQDAGQIWNSTTTLAGGVQYSSSGPAPGIEAMITFEWDGTQGGTETKTVLFGAAVPSVITTASGWLNAPLSVVLPEKVIKTYRSAYLRTTVHHSQATSITAGNVLIGVNGTSSPYAITVAEAADTTSEAFAADYLVPVASSTFSNGDTITWTSRNLEINATLSVANTQAFNHVLSVTYDAGYPYHAFLELSDYRWFFDNGGETAATPVVPENTPVSSGFYPGDTLRLRFLVQNVGLGATTTRFQLEYASSSCVVWYPVSTFSSWKEWNVRSTQYVPHGALTTNRSEVIDPDGLAFAPGYVSTNANPAPPLSLIARSFSEIEWNVGSSEFVSSGVQYCFRMTNNDSLYHYDILVTPSVVLSPESIRPVSGGVQIEESGFGFLQLGGNTTGGTTTTDEGSGSGAPIPGGGQGGGGGDLGRANTPPALGFFARVFRSIDSAFSELALLASVALSFLR